MINGLDLNGDDLGLLDVDSLDDSDWLLSTEKPNLADSLPTEEWLQQGYDKKELHSVKWSLIYALDIARNRNKWSNHASSPARSPAAKTFQAPYIPGNSSSKDLTDIHILARMQEENLRESTLQRRRRNNSLMPQVMTNRNGDHSINNFGSPFSTNSRAQCHPTNGLADITSHRSANGIENGVNYSSDESPERFRGRNYTDQGTFKVKRKTLPDKIRRPVIEPISQNVQAELMEEEMENTEQNVYPASVVTPLPVIEHSEVAFKNSQMISDMRRNEIGNGRHLPHRPEIVSPRNEHASKATVNTTATQGASKESLEKPTPTRNRSIPRNRTGIPVMSAAPNKHVSPNSRLPASRNTNNDKGELSARRRNSSGSVISTTALKKFNNTNGLPNKTNRSIPTSSSSQNLRKLSQAGNGKVLSNNHEEFY